MDVIGHGVTKSFTKWQKLGNSWVFSLFLHCQKADESNLYKRYFFGKRLIWDDMNKKTNLACESEIRCFVFYFKVKSFERVE